MPLGALARVPAGTHFADRRSLLAAEVHRDIRRGICGSGTGVAESVVLSARYEDDEDFGELVYYTGQGGRDPRSGVQVADQEMTGPNRSLARNAESGVTVRVIRRVDGGYRYDGLYGVEDAWMSLGKRGFLVCRYRLRAATHFPSGEATGSATVARRLATHYRLVRDLGVALTVKVLHDFTCQVCGIRLDTAAGAYAEAAHLLPLGGGHDGPDVTENILCLCPNDHVRLDHGAIFLTDTLDVVDRAGNVLGPLRRTPGHILDLACVRAHRAMFGR